MLHRFIGSCRRGMSYWEGTDRSRAGMEAALASLMHKGEELQELAKTAEVSLLRMEHYLARMNLDLHASSTKIIHVAGTKGKGSTCALVESILRSHGVRTGLFTSPHLVSVHERFRLDGQPVSDQLFLSHFWDVWDALMQTRSVPKGPALDGAYVTPMPGYFRFLTLLALKMFLQEKVDCLVLEVGVGGRLDPTNIVAAPQVIATAVTTLDYDHCQVLGHTLEKIAYEKSGIFKRNVPCFTVPQLSTGADRVLQERAKEAGCSLTVLQPLTNNEIRDKDLGLRGAYQRSNAAVAVELAKVYLKRDGIAVISHVPDSFIPGLRTCSWPGRCQRIQDVQRSNVTYLLDGAHTPLSMQACVQWLEEELKHVPQKTRVHLLFNCSVTRNPFDLLAPLRSIASLYRTVLYVCPFNQEKPRAMEMSSLTSLVRKSNQASTLDHDTLESFAVETWIDVVTAAWQLLNPLPLPYKTPRSMPDAVALIHQQAIKEPSEQHVVIATGSLYTVGNLLEHINGHERDT